MFVKANANLKVPMEHTPSSHIDDSVIVKVPDDSAYYARRITDKDLVEVTEAEFDAQQQAIITRLAEADVLVAKETKKNDKTNA